MKLLSRVVWIFLILLFSTALYAADDITGLWQSINEETGDPQTICMIYLYQGEIYGRILITYDDENPGEIKDSYMNPEARAELLVGDPYYAGLDFIWGLKDRGNKWARGNILDPKKGKVYSSELWLEDGNLIVRGKIGPFGRSQVWVPVNRANLPPGFIVPNPSDFEPQIPQVK